MGTDSDFGVSVAYKEAIFRGVDHRKNTPDGALEAFRRFLSCRPSVPRTLEAAIEAFRKMREKQGAEDLTGLLEQHPRLRQTYLEAAGRKPMKRAGKAKLPLSGAAPKRKAAARPASKARAGRRRS